jgi:hypothetical protein
MPKGVEYRFRTFQAGDEVAQVSIYNEAVGALPKFKPAVLDEVRRRVSSPDFDPSTRLYAVAAGQPVGYATWAANGRISFPWCRPGHEDQAEPLLEAVLKAMRQRGLKTAFAAYRADWVGPREFLLAHGFQQTREMINYVMDLAEMPTPSARPSSLIAPVTVTDLPGFLALAPDVLGVATVEALQRYLFANPYFPPDAAFVLHSRSDGQPVAAGMLVVNPTYADPYQLDSDMPCFRLGAFGTEEQNCKRVNGLFSVLVGNHRALGSMALDLLAYAAHKAEAAEVNTLCAQVSTGAAHLARFYKQYFRRQGSFPIYERTL